MPERNVALCRRCGMPCPSGLLHCSLACEEATPEPTEEPKRFHSGEQVFEHYVPGYRRPERPQPTYPVEGCYDDRD